MFVFCDFVFVNRCRSRQPAQKTEETTTIKEIVRDTIFEVPAENTSYTASLTCKDGKVAIEEIIDIKDSKGALAIPKVKIENNKLIVDCETRAQELLAQWKEKHTTTRQIETRVEYKEKELTVFQKIRLFLGSVVLISLGVGVAFSIYKLIKK